MTVLEIFNVLLAGWFVGFMSFLLIDAFSSVRKIKKEQIRHDMEMARIKASRSVGR